VVHVLRVNRRLSVSERRWRQLVSTTPLAVIVADAQQRVQLWNKAARKLFGWTSKQAIGQRMTDLIVPKAELPQVEQALEKARSAGYSHSVNTNVTRDGQLLSCEWHNTSFVSAEGKVLWSISLGADISQRVRAHQMLEDAKALSDQLLRDQRQFFNMVSHELRAPLGVIDAALQLLELRLRQDPAHQDVLKRVRRGVKRLAVFVENCLTEDRLSQDAAGQFQPAAIELAPSLDNVLEQTCLAWPTHRLPWQAQGLLALGEQWCDEVLLGIALGNLLGNACKYSQPGSAVTLAAERLPDGGLRLTVSDCGVGIAPEDLGKVCLRYFRGQRRNQASGVGLGLYVVQQVVSVHGGQIDITSTVGEGTQVRLTLPDGRPGRSPASGAAP
jgi:PAS domain S-box-containing protein